MNDNFETGKKTTKADKEFEAPTTGGEVEELENAEFELTQEIEEKVMEKVQDIGEPGIAFHGDLYGHCRQTHNTEILD